MNVLITGGTGFVGKHLTNELTKQNHHVYILTRSPDKHTNTNSTTFISYKYDMNTLPVIHKVINLAGDSLFGYWSKKKKATILSSRIETTQTVIDFMKQMDPKPTTFISGSAVGYYGTSKDLIFTEDTIKPGDDFLARVVVKWEKTANQATNMGIRTIFTRFGVILGEDGALPYMSLPVKMFAGGKIGNGEQWISWVHIEDVVQMILFCLFNENMVGPVNITSPNPSRNKEFTKTLAKVLKRPYWLPAPSPIIRTTIGEMSHLITKGQYVLPRKAESNNYQFAYPYLEESLRQITAKKSRH
ncbi:TIGR01777 family oxidoreductase [Virgibacillus ndiopensis]|uniref:TIGR01777 family oxidoreductase n=1 Tax=Virgibacillus ndiopensis TaxID=2004408 RepID=UPI000C086F7A|nr:TIGR01777 family oxidoreductase [Virgibacillus ndiopensis]